MEFIKVKDDYHANLCDELLTELIQSERKFDNNVKETFIVKDMYKNKYKEDYNCLILVMAEDDPIAFIFSYMKFEQGDFCYHSTAHIDALYVKPQFRNKGIAGKLIVEFTNWCNNKNIKEIEIGVFKENSPAYNLYKKMGFIDTTIYMNKKLI